jgi:PAS domain S-box-containing protein
LRRQSRSTSAGNNLASERLIEHLRQTQAELEIQNQALRYSQAAAEGASERFVTLFSTVPLALMVVDVFGQILEVNARALALLRPQEADAPLNYLEPLVLHSHQDRVSRGFRFALNNGTCELTEVEFAGGSNGTIIGDMHVARIESVGGDEVQSFICAIIDQGPLLAQRSALQTSAAALRERNQDLQESQSRLAAIINSSLDAIIGVDAQQQVVVFNPAAAALFGWPASQALGQPLQTFLPDTLLPEQAEGQQVLGEVSGSTRTGASLPLEVSLSMQRQGAGPITTLFIHDLTSRRRMEAHRAELERQLRESQKMQAIGTMAGGIAHDFNNIISAILGNVTLAQQDSQHNPAVAQSLAEIDKAGRRARDLVRQILTFSRNDPPKRAPLHLASVMQDTAHLLRVTLPPHIQLHLEVHPQVPEVLADTTQMEQVLLNLCTNAIQAIGARPGDIWVTLSCHQRRGHPQVLLSVRDNGPGMDPTTRDRVFEPFFTTKPVGQGTGLGLSVVHGIMQAHQGSVQVSSHIGKGSQFLLTFDALVPVNKAQSAPIFDSPVSEHPTIAHGQGQEVVYVDDDDALVFLVKRVLTRRGYKVTTFSDPRQASRALCDTDLPCQLLVTDYNMPGYSGVDLMRDVKRARPDLPVALASGYVTPEIEAAALQAGAQALIHKPNDVDELCATVHALLMPQAA